MQRITVEADDVRGGDQARIHRPPRRQRRGTGEEMLCQGQEVQAVPGRRERRQSTRVRLVRVEPTEQRRCVDRGVLRGARCERLPRDPSRQRRETRALVASEEVDAVRDAPRPVIRARLPGDQREERPSVDADRVAADRGRDRRRGRCGSEGEHGRRTTSCLVVECGASVQSNGCIPVGPHCSVAAAGSVVVQTMCAEYAPGAGAATSAIENVCGAGAGAVVGARVGRASFRGPVCP